MYSQSDNTAVNRQKIRQETGRGNTSPGNCANNRAIQRQILNESGFSMFLDLAAKQEKFDFSLGFTPPTVNGSKIIYKDEFTAAFTGANGIVNVEKKGDEEYIAMVVDVPRNHVGYMMYLPKPGPWKKVADKGQILMLFDKADNGNNLTNEIDFEVTGPQGHEKLSKQVKAHEQVHANDNERIRDKVLKPWDEQLMSYQKHQRLFSGKSQAEAESKLWQSAGGDPDAIAEQVTKAWGEASNDFHDSKKGKTHMDDKGMVMNENQTKAVVSYYLSI